ncbi:MAG: hypothetical protein ACK52V_04675 [Betaproteobacteria bacterium]
MYTSRIENPMVVGAAAQYDAMCAYGDRLEAAVESALEELLADEGSVEEAIGEQADVIHAALMSGREAAEVVDLINASIRSYLRAQAEAHCDRNPAKWGG